MDKKPEGLFGYTGLTTITLKSGAELTPGEIVQAGFEAWRENGTTGYTEAEDWNALPESERRTFCLAALAHAVAQVKAASAARDASMDNALIDLTERELGRSLIDAALTEVKHQQRPWEAMTADQQTEVLERITAQVKAAVGKALRDLATRGNSHILCTLEQITVKKEAKLTLTLPRGEVAEDLLEAVGQAVILVIGGTLDAGEIQTPQAEPDQRALELAADQDQGD